MLPKFQWWRSGLSDQKKVPSIATWTSWRVWAQSSKWCHNAGSGCRDDTYGNPPYQCSTSWSSARRSEWLIWALPFALCIPSTTLIVLIHHNIDPRNEVMCGFSSSCLRLRTTCCACVDLCGSYRSLGDVPTLATFLACVCIVFYHLLKSWIMMKISLGRGMANRLVMWLVWLTECLLLQSAW